jgi:dTDP-glucose 4,6-dehydratase
MDRLVVTGGLGFIGSNFIHHILETREEVAIVNVDYHGPGSNPANLRDLRNNTRYAFIEGDLADPRVSRKALRSSETVVNFAAETHVDRSIADPKPFFRSNLNGMFNLLEASREYKIRKLVHISTDEVYGSIETGSFDEEAPLTPSSPYSATKAAADLLARAWNATYRVPVMILRSTNNFGPYQHPEKLIPKTIIRALKGQEIPLYGGGKQVRDWIFVKDFCLAIEKALEKGDPGEIYNISAGNELTNRDVAERLLKQLGKAVTRIVEVEDRPAHDFRYSLLSSKARQQLDWRPRHAFDEALIITAKWYQDNQGWWKPLATPKTLSATPWKERQ